MKLEDIANNNQRLLLRTIKNLGFTLVEISKNIYPSNHHNYLSGRFSEKRIKPKDIVLVINYITSQIGEPVFEMEYKKEIDRYNELIEKQKALIEKSR